MSASPQRTLEKHRTYGTGPAYRKIGGRVVYTLEELRSLGRSRCLRLNLRSEQRRGPSGRTPPG